MSQQKGGIGIAQVLLIGGLGLAALCLIGFGAFMILQGSNTPIIALAPPALPSATSGQLALIPTSQLEATYTVPPSYTPPATYTPLPTYTTQPTATFYPTSTPQPALPSATPAFAPGNQSEFNAYLMQHYSTIAGQTLPIEAINIFDQSGFRSVSIRITIDSGLNVFIKQSQANRLAYGQSLLEDTIQYFGGQDCSAYVEDVIYTTDLSLYSGDQWDSLGDWSNAEDGWAITTYYVKAYFLSGNKAVKVW